MHSSATDWLRAGPRVAAYLVAWLLGAMLMLDVHAQYAPAPYSGSVYNPAAVAITGGTINGTTAGATTPASGAFTTAAIAGGTINATTIGAATPSTGAFTTASTTAALTVGSTITNYNGIGTVANGVPIIVARQVLTAQSVNLGATTIYTAPAAGRYRVSCYVVVTQSAAVSGTPPSCAISWTDAAAAVSVTEGLTVGSLSNTKGQYSAGEMIISAASGSTISYSTSGYLSIGAPALQYSVGIYVEALGN